jgi:hypothetical protein
MDLGGGCSCFCEPGPTGCVFTFWHLISGSVSALPSSTDESLDTTELDQTSNGLRGPLEQTARASIRSRSPLPRIREVGSNLQVLSRKVELGFGQLVEALYMVCRERQVQGSKVSRNTPIDTGMLELKCRTAANVLHALGFASLIFFCGLGLLRRGHHSSAFLLFPWITFGLFALGFSLRIVAYAAGIWKGIPKRLYKHFWKIGTGIFGIASSVVIFLGATVARNSVVNVLHMILPSESVSHTGYSS